MNPTETATEQIDIEPVTKSDLLEIASWNRPRTSEELQSFIASREAAING